MRTCNLRRCARGTTATHRRGTRRSVDCRSTHTTSPGAGRILLSDARLGIRCRGRGAGSESRSSLRSWLYRIATNVCLDLLDGKKRRARPMDLSSPSAAPTTPGDQLADAAWIEPIPDNAIFSTSDDPAEAAVSRESIQLAFIAALQHLSPRQRAVLLLRDVVGLRASEVGVLMGCTVASVTSALQRPGRHWPRDMARRANLRPLHH